MSLCFCFQLRTKRESATETWPQTEPAPGGSPADQCKRWWFQTVTSQLLHADRLNVCAVRGSDGRQRVSSCWVFLLSIPAESAAGVFHSQTTPDTLKITFPINHILQLTDLILILQCWDWSLYVSRVLIRLFVINGPVPAFRPGSAWLYTSLDITQESHCTSSVCAHRPIYINIWTLSILMWVQHHLGLLSETSSLWGQTVVLLVNHSGSCSWMFPADLLSLQQLHTHTLTYTH